MAKGSSKIPDSFLERENELLVNRNFNQKLIREEQQKKEGADMEKIKASEKLVFELNAELEKLVEEMEKNYPDYLEQKKQTNPASFETARKNLTDNKASLVEFMIGEKNAYIFLLTKNDLQLFKIKEKEKLEERVRRLRELITTPPSIRNFDSEFQEFTNLSYLLYSQILKEGIENLSKGINRLVIIPDDLLCYLPFEILIREKPKNEVTLSDKAVEKIVEPVNYTQQAKTFFLNFDTVNYRVMSNMPQIYLSPKEDPIDLLFFHKGLQCQVAFDLKKEDFRPDVTSTMERYLKAIDGLLKKNQVPPIGITFLHGTESQFVIYSFRDSNAPTEKPSFIHTFLFPDHYKGVLPDPAELIQLLKQ